MSLYQKDDPWLALTEVPMTKSYSI
uniref:Uncharacterized protein n=1 Tax=Anguilla anguilla TaxID=7936 RepID=A0A0E9PUA0_ANGAN